MSLFEKCKLIKSVVVNNKGRQRNSYALHHWKGLKLVEASTMAKLRQRVTYIETLLEESYFKSRTKILKKGEK